MASREQRRAEQIRRQLVRLLTDAEGTLPGSLVVRSLRCGRAGCACHADPPQLHGPYVQWSYSFRGKRVNRWLSPEQVQLYRPQVDRGRHLKELLAELDAAEILRAEHDQGWGA